MLKMELKALGGGKKMNAEEGKEDEGEEEEQEEQEGREGCSNYSLAMPRTGRQQVTHKGEKK